MRLSVAVLACSLLVLGPAAAEDDPREAAKPLTIPQGADAVLQAVDAKDTPALTVLTKAYVPDPWLVAEELCGRSAGDAARAFAAAGEGPVYESLVKYLQAGCDRGDAEVRKAVLAAERALATSSPAKALAALESVKMKGAGLQRARLLITLAEAFNGMRRGPDAVAVETESVNLCKGIGWTMGHSRALLNLGIHAARSGRLSEAAAQIVTARDIADKGGNHLVAMHSASILGQIAWSRRQLTESLAHMRRAAAFADALGDPRMMGSMRTRVGEVLNGMQRHEEAIKPIAESLEMFTRLGDKVEIARANTNLGLAHGQISRYAQSIAFFRRAHALRIEIGDTVGAAQDLANMGSSLSDGGDHMAALDALMRALPVLKASGQPGRIMPALTSIGLLQRRLGRYALALSTFESAVALVGNSPQERSYAGATWGQMGVVHHMLGDNERALECFEQGLVHLRAVGDAGGELIILSNRAASQAAMGDLEAALASSKQVVDAFEKRDDHYSASAALITMGATYGDLERRDEEAACYERAREMASQGGYELTELHALVNLGTAYYRQEKYAEAEVVQTDALARATALGATHIEIRALEGLAAGALRTNRAAEALAHAKAAVLRLSSLTEGLSESEGAGGRESYTGVLDVGIGASLATSDVSSLVWFLERGRAQALLEGLGARAVIETAVVPDQLNADLRAARVVEVETLKQYRSVSGKRRRVREARDVWEAARAKVRAASARIEREAKAAAQVVMGETDELPAIQARLNADDALIMLGETKQIVLAVVITNTDASVVKLGAVAPLITAIEGLALDDTSVEPSAAIAKLAGLLATPLKLPSDVKRVLVSPTGRFGYVPFTLMFPEQEVSFLPSGTTHGALLAMGAAPGKQILGLGDPEYGAAAGKGDRTRYGGRTRLARLAATRAEVQAIADVHLLGAEASESALVKALASVKADARWRAVHFACHGLVESNRPEESALALTPDEVSDGFLKAIEILPMKIPADLVTMSACETGKGKIYKTEGIIGLTRAFMFAGAPRVICSLWKVDDEATQALMVEFYRLWNPKDGSKGMGTAAALKKAQAFVRTHPKHPQWKHPYYWAAWVLWGLPD